ncbi:MAG: fructosamine kinase family protein, partial [Bacteroidia bacterium]|nr:fructosamine kinase family protein [Bacteroidia bacterium]
LEALFEGIKPSLLHGDLWNGNYLIDKSGTPYLIDPAVYYGHSEVDIAMTKLFGGFGDSFYQAYHTIIPLDDKSHARIEVYKLYYLLVHLNLFGRSYYPQVKRIMETYFN